MNFADPAGVNPGATLDWSWDWSAWLTGSDSIASHLVTLSEGLTLVGSSTAAAGVVGALLQVGATAAPGQWLTAKCRITTTAGLIETRTIYMRVNNPMT